CRPLNSPCTERWTTSYSPIREVTSALVAGTGPASVVVRRDSLDFGLEIGIGDGKEPSVLRAARRLHAQKNGGARRVGQLKLLVQEATVLRVLQHFERDLIEVRGGDDDEAPALDRGSRGSHQKQVEFARRLGVEAGIAVGEARVQSAHLLAQIAL